MTDNQNPHDNTKHVDIDFGLILGDLIESSLDRQGRKIGEKKTNRDREDCPGRIKPKKKKSTLTMRD